MPMSTAVTGSNISLVTEGCHKEGGEKVNKKIRRYMEEIEKTEKKISDLQQYLKGIKSALKEEENNEMIRAIRGMKLEGEELLRFLDGLRGGTVRFEVGKEKEGQESNTEREDKNNDKEME